MASIYLTGKQRQKRVLEMATAKFGTKAAFARAMKLHRQNINVLTGSENPRIDTLIRYAKALGVEVQVFIYK